MKRRIIFAVTLVLALIVGLGILLEHKINAAPSNDYLTDEALVLVDKSNGTTAVYCHHEYNTGQVDNVYGNTIPTSEVSNYKFGCARHTIHIKE